MLRLRLTLPARKDIAALLDWSADHFGAAGRRRYEALLDTALRDITEAGRSLASDRGFASIIFD
jgi:toxin ParE1/3/4